MPLLEDRAREPVLFGHTPLAAAFRFIEPTWRNYIMYVDLEARTGNPDAQRYLKLWSSLPPSERRTHVPEQICQLAVVAASDLIRWVTGQAWLEGSAKANLCMSFMRDKVLEKTAQFAMDSPDNYRHADLFMRASGTLPQAARGGGTTIFNVPVASSNSIAGAKSDSAAALRSGSMLGMDEEIVELSKIMQRDESSVRATAEEMSDPDDDEDDDDSDDKD